MSALVSRLAGYFPAKYGDERLAALDRFVGAIDPAEHDRIYAWITEERAVSTAIGVADIKQACIALGIPCHAGFTMRARRLECAACGNSYSYLPAVSEAQQLEEGIHYRCPQCGLAGSEQIKAELMTKDGKIPDWFTRLVEHYRTWLADGRWNNGEGGRFFDPVKERAAIIAHRKRAMGIVEDLAREKAYAPKP
jgi:hypothetical protein